ncbi:MAG: exodeoxyribonuclease III [Patescibacteria group bacterium UBA2103]
MKLVSWNVNGLRSLSKNGYWEDFLKLDADIFGLQEIKAEEEQLPEEMRAPKGYVGYFNSSKTRKGYSGVALYSKEEPFEVFSELGIKELDQEGRLIGAEFKDFYVFNVYFPNGGGGPERLAYKLDFYDAFLEFVEEKRKKKPVIFMGDVNTAHEEIDLARPKANEENTGFLPEERAWLDEVVNAGYVDTFRHFFPAKADMYSYWDMKTRARDRNVGWRIDYIFASQELTKKLKNVAIHSDVYGSDHCPISLEIK